MKNILTGRIDYLNFKDGETVRSTRTIRTTCSTVAKLIYIYNRNIRKGMSKLKKTILSRAWPYWKL
jgi:hypothetical protein